MKIIIPMAGLGTRFSKVADKNPEYLKPKPFINVKGVPMVRWATGSIPFIKHKDRKSSKKKGVEPKDLVFIVLKEHDDQHAMEKTLKEIYSQDINVIVLDKVTRGAAETAYKAKHLVDMEDELIVMDSDTFFDGRHLADVIDNKGPDIVGIIPIFRARNEGIPKWSYSQIHPETHHIEKVAEKDRAMMEAGAYANIGAYYFAKGKYFINLAEEIINRGEKFGEPGKTEFYVAPLYQTLLNRGMKLKAAIVPEEDMWGMGTPEDLEYFLKNYKGDRPLY